MPSLFKYFTFVGGGLLGLLIALDAVMQPGGPGPNLVNVAAPKVVVVNHDPQASRVERLRAEEAALKATVKTELSPTTDAPIPLAPPPAVTQGSEQPAAEQMISPTALTSTPTEDEATRAAQFAQEKRKAEKARKKRLARERAKAHEEAASRQQDQLYYGFAALNALLQRDRRPVAAPPMVR
jgi:hypothetical protein